MDSSDLDGRLAPPDAATVGLTVDGVARVAASLLGELVPGERPEWSWSDPAIEFALYLIERSALAVEGRGSPTAQAAYEARYRVGGMRARELWEKAQREREERSEEDEIGVARAMAERLNGKTYRQRLIELGLVRKGATMRDVEKWEREFTPKQLPQERAEWIVVALLKGWGTRVTGESPSLFDPVRDLNDLKLIGQHSEWWRRVKAKERAEAAKKRGKKLAKHPKAKANRKPIGER